MQRNKMVEITDPDVQIILNIKEGKGFEQILQPTLLVGTLNGHSLETYTIEASANPQYMTDFIWETNKTALRKMRSGQVPLKLECFAFKENEDRERIGYILLSIRSAQVTSKYGNLNPKANWYKLLGLRSDFKLYKPELSLTLTIDDRKSIGSSTIREKFAQIESHRNPSGDFEKCNVKSIPCETKYPAEYENKNKYSTDSQFLKDRINIMHSSDTMLCNCIKKNHENVGSYYCYCLHISLMTITFVSSELFGRQVELRFHHPKTEVISTLTTMSALSGEKIKLQDIECQFHFISASDEIKHLLETFPPKISMYDTNAYPKLISSSVFDVKPLFYQDKPECQYKLPLYDMGQNKIGDMDVMLKLDNRGPHYILKTETTSKNLGPPILDDSLAYKIVDELETWKDRQKEMFKFELKRKEERHLNILSEEWRKQKENLESKLACSVEQCKMLANSLNNATEDLRTRRLKNLENETRLIKSNKDLQWRHETNLQEFKDSFDIMRSDLTSKITILEERKAALEAQNEILLYENESMKSLMRKQTNELEMYQKGSLTQDQTASVLQELKILEEKLDNAQKGKMFFKEQWGKAVREMHKLKVDYQQSMQIEIKNSKEKLKNVDLTEFMDTAALANDQILLNELQKEIDVIKPKKNFLSKETYDQIFLPVNNICSNVSFNNNRTTYKMEEYNERLQALTEERDSLLRTGSYTNDDILIKKLNTEIQSLLTNR